MFTQYNHQVLIYYRVIKSCTIRLSCYLVILLLFGCGLNNPFSPGRPPNPDPPTLISPLDKAIIGQGVSVTFNWQDVIYREQYRFQISQHNNFSNLLVDSVGLLVSQNRVLLSDTGKYFWRVRVQTKTYRSWSNWSNVWSFRVAKDTTPPIIPHSPFPDDGAENVIVNITLSWISGNTDTVTYYVYIGEDSATLEIKDTIIDGRGISPVVCSSLVTQTTFPLAESTLYFWQVKAEDIDGAVTGAIWRFTTGSGDNDPPVIDAITGPEWVYADDECIFKVSATDPDGDNVSYQIDFGDGNLSGWSSFVPCSDTIELSHTYRRFNEHGNIFEVRARAKDIHYATGEWSMACSVRVKANSGACIVADYVGVEIVKISAQGSVLGRFGRQPFKPSIVTVDITSGDIWVGCWYENTVYKVAPSCTLLGIWGSWNRPDLHNSSPTDLGVAYNGNCWVCCAETQKLLLLNKDTGETERFISDVLGPLIFPQSIALDEARNTIWVAESDITGGGYVSKFNLTTGARVGQIPGFSLSRLALNPDDGTCWVADAHTRKVFQIFPNCSAVVVAEGFYRPTWLSLYLGGGYAWVSDSSRIIKLMFDGSWIISPQEFEDAIAVEVDPNDGSCWVNDRAKKSIIKVDYWGNKLFEIPGFEDPIGITVNPNPDP